MKYTENVKSCLKHLQILRDSSGDDKHYQFILYDQMITTALNQLHRAGRELTYEELLPYKRRKYVDKPKLKLTAETDQAVKEIKFAVNSIRKAKKLEGGAVFQHHITACLFDIGWKKYNRDRQLNNILRHKRDVQKWIEEVDNDDGIQFT